MKLHSRHRILSLFLLIQSLSVLSGVLNLYLCTSVQTHSFFTQKDASPSNRVKTVVVVAVVIALFNSSLLYTKVSHKT